jgi:hypothetical protein
MGGEWTGQLSQILEPVHEMIASKRATAGELRQRGVREPELMAQLHKLANELDSNANEMAQRLRPQSRWSDNQGLSSGVHPLWVPTPP